MSLKKLQIATLILVPFLLSTVSLAHAEDTQSLVEQQALNQTQEPENSNLSDHTDSNLVQELFGQPSSSETVVQRPDQNKPNQAVPTKPTKPNTQQKPTKPNKLPAKPLEGPRPPAVAVPQLW